MKRKIKQAGLILCMILVAGMVTGCNTDAKIKELVQQGDEAYTAARYEEAIEAYGQILELDDQKDEIYNNRGMAYLNTQQYDLALSDFSKAIELEGGVDIYYNNRGLVYYYQEKYEEAVADFSKAIEMNAGDAGYFSNRGDAYHAMEAYDEAIQDYDQALLIEPSRLITLNNRASAYFNLEKYEEAVADYTTAIEKQPESDIVYWNRGEAYRMLGKYEKALEDYQTYAANTTEKLSTEFLFKRAEVYAAMEEYDLALADYADAIEQDPQDMVLYQGRANIHYQRGAYQEAIDDYTKYLESGDDAVALGNRGYCYLQLENLEQALNDLNRCIELKSDYAWAYYTRGQILQKMERYEDAKKDYDKANQMVTK